MAELVVALDVPDRTRAMRLVEELSPLGVLFKVGYEAYYGYGADLARQLERLAAGYVLDLKLHDIPRTVAAAMEILVRPGVRSLTLHALGGTAMLAAGREAAAERAALLGIDRPLCFAVTILTSLSADDVIELGLQGAVALNVMRLAGLARRTGCDGVVCSPREASEVKRSFGGELKTFCPGIRPAGHAGDDQKRAMTPPEAAAAGADYLVVGRPVTGSDDPAGTVRAILADLTPVVR